MHEWFRSWLRCQEQCVPAGGRGETRPPDRQEVGIMVMKIHNRNPRRLLGVGCLCRQPVSGSKTGGHA